MITPDTTVPPLLFDHGPATELLVSAARLGRLPQSVLLVGPPGVGKRAAANRVSATLLCTAEEDQRPCGTCRACRLVRDETHPDVDVLPAPLKIEAVRALQTRLVLTPAEGSVRVVVVLDVDVATIAAANCLLKTLEEPPAYARLLLTTGSPADVLPTIRSRCQTVRFPRWTAAAIASALEANGVAPPEAELLARLADGRIAWAHDFAARPAAMADRSRWFDELAGCLHDGVAERLERAARLAGADAEGAVGLAVWRGLGRDLLLASADVPEAVVNTDVASELVRWATALGAQGALALVTAVETALTRLAANGNRQLVFEALVLEMPRVRA